MVKVLQGEDPSPLFLRMKKAIFDELMAAGLKPNDRLPSENELCRRSDVSIRTVRRALTELERDGVIVRRQGVGSFLRDLNSRKNRDVQGAIGILFSDIAFVSRPMFSALLRAVERETLSRNYSFHLYATGDRLSKNDPLIPLSELLPDDKVSGLIAASALNAEDIAVIRRRKLPLVTFNAYRGERVNTVRLDYYDAARQGVRFLLKRGCREIAFVCGRFSDKKDAPVIFNHDYFRRGVRDELIANGAPFAERLFFQTPLTRDDGSRLVSSIMRNAEKPDAFFVTDPLLAEGVADAFQMAGIDRADCPELLSFGFSGALPGVDKLEAPLAKFAAETIKALVRVMAGDRGTKRQKVIKLTLKPKSKEERMVAAI